MRKRDYTLIFNLIEKGELRRASNFLESNLRLACFGFLISRTGQVHDESRNELFDNAFIEFWEEIEEGSFKFINEAACLTYFKTKLKFKVLDYYREKKKKAQEILIEYINQIKGPKEGDETIVGNDLEDEYNQEMDNFINEKIEKQGIELDFEDDSQNFMQNGNTSFIECVWDKIKKLSEKCQDLIHFRFFENLEWKEIASILNEAINSGEIIEKANALKANFSKTCIKNLAILSRECLK